LLEDFKNKQGEAYYENRIVVAPGTKVEYVNYDDNGIATVKVNSLPAKGLIIEQGQVLSVHTPRMNAAGKQTFLKALARILLPVDGFIHYPPNLRVRFIAPEPQLLTGTVYRNLTFGNQTTHSGADMRAACKLFKLSEDLYSCDDEKDSESWGKRSVGLNGEKLALSERIRIVLIRALLSSADLLLLHNVLDPLGPNDADDIIQILKEFVKDRGVKCLSMDMRVPHHVRKQKTVVISTKSPHIESVVHNTLVLNMSEVDGSDGVLPAIGIQTH